MMFRSAFVLSAALLVGQVGASVASAQDVDAGAGESVASETDALQGRPNAANSAACGCSTVGARTELPPLVVVAGGLLLVAAASRRRLAR